MLTRTLSFYRNAYSGLTPHIWWLSLVMLINRAGTMVLPFMTIYLTSPEMGYSIGKAGIIMALFGAGSICGGFLGGRLTDKVGFYPVQLIALLGGGIMFIVLGQMKSFPLIGLFTFLMSMVNDAFRPANSAAVAQYSEEGNRTRSYSLNRLAINLGWAVGSAVGGVLAAINYELLFWVDGITNISAALLMWFFLPARHHHIKPAPVTPQDLPVQSAYRDKTYVLFIVFTTLFASCFFQIFTTLTAYFRNIVHFSEQFIGFLGALNGVIIVIVEMVLIYRLEGRRTPLFYIIRGVLLCAVAYMLLNFFPNNTVLAVIMMTGFTVGEILSMPFMNSYWIARTQPGNRGAYAGLYAMSWAIAQAIGPLYGAQVAQYFGYTTLWWVIAGVCLAATAGFIFLYRLAR